MLLDSYFGSDLSTDRYDELSLIKIKEKYLDTETKLYQTKWISYRHLHPAKATYLYAAHYTNEYRKMYRMTKDSEKGKYVTGSKGKDAMQKSATLGFWKGRQNSDLIGMPYNLYIESAMRCLVKNTIWKRIPRPQQLYSEKVIEFVKEDWLKTLQLNTITHQTHHLSDDNEFDAQCKLDIEIWLCKQIQGRRNQHLSLSHYIFEEKTITEKTALQYFSVEAIDRARNHYNR